MFYDIFVDLCNQKGVSPNKACIEMGLSRSLAAKWKSTKTNPSLDVLKKISSYFDVTTDYLTGNENSEQKEMPALTKKDERDIEKKLNETLEELELSQDSLMFNGEPLDDITKELLIQSIRNGIELSKKLAKEKYTPKKYKK